MSELEQDLVIYPDGDRAETAAGQASGLWTIVRGAATIAGLVIFLWPMFDVQFRDAEGNLTGLVCIPFAAGVGLVLIGAAAGTRWLPSSLWLCLAMVGQAVTFQLINAGWQLRYQHYKPLSEVMGSAQGRLFLVFLLFQAAVVAASFRRVAPPVVSWLRKNLRWWQFLLLATFFVLPAATVSPNVWDYLSELTFAVFIQLLQLGTILVFALSIPANLPPRLAGVLTMVAAVGEPKETITRGGFGRLTLSLAICVAVVAAVLCIFSYQRHPHVPDEVAYLTEARFFAAGVLTMPAPPVPGGFDVFLMRTVGDRWYPVPPPGWPMVLAIGAFLGAPWLINPILAGLNLLLAFALLREIFPRNVSRMSIVLLALSPWYVFLGMSFMTHMVSLTCLLTAALGVVYSRKNGSSVWALAAGLSLGMLSLVRPLEAAGMAGLIGLWAIGVGGSRLRLAALTSLFAGTIAVGAIGLWYNAALTGDPLRIPINEYADAYFGKNANAYGFGPDRGMGWAMDPYPGHSPIDALVNSNLNSSAINTELFGWGLGSLLLVGFGLCLGRLGRSDYLMIAVVAVIYGLHFFYYFSGGPDFGGRYWFLMILPLVVFAARGARELAARVGRPASVYAAVLALCLISAMNFIPWRAIDKYRNFRGMRPDIRYLAEKAGFGRSLVLVQGNKHPDYDSAMVYNPLDLKADAPVYAWDRDPEVRQKLLAAYSDRPVWIVRSPSLTGKGYEVAAGPVPAGELLRDGD